MFWDYKWGQCDLCWHNTSSLFLATPVIIVRHVESFVSALATDINYKVPVYLIDMKEEYRQVKEDDDQEGHNEDDGQRGEDPQQILQNTQVVLLTEACPFLPRMKQAHLRTKTQRSTLLPTGDNLRLGVLLQGQFNIWTINQMIGEQPVYFRNHSYTMRPYIKQR